MGQRSKRGTCRLTGKPGLLVKSHIIPKALTRPSEAGAPLLQSTKGQGFKRRWSSWFDGDLVTREGEDILSEIDDLAIKVLRNHKLIWSAWLPFKPAFQKLTPFSDGPSLRQLAFSQSEGEALHRFVLSIIWRAAASNLPDMSDVKIDSNIEERLRQALLDNAPPPLELFPTSVTQLTTLGEVHNQTPYIDVKRQPAMLGLAAKDMRILRLYIDGLIFHSHFDSKDVEPLNGNSLIIGASDKLIVSGVTYERSFQYENLLTVAYEAALGPLGSPIK